MARSVYGIRTPLNRSLGDVEIPLFSQKSIPLKSLLIYMAGLLTMLWLVMKAWPIGTSSWWIRILFIFVFSGIMLWAGAPTKTKELTVQQIPATLEYVPRRSRHIVTRTVASPASFYSMVGIREVDSSGLIEYANGDVGQMYLVVGTASVLLFDQDRDDIIDRNDAFWRKVSTDAEWNFITVREPQRVDSQIVHTQELMNQLEPRDPELMDLLDERYEILANYVGHRFRSMHQYLLLRARNFELLEESNNTLMKEKADSDRMFKAITPLNDTETFEALSVIYRTKG